MYFLFKNVLEICNKLEIFLILFHTDKTNMFIISQMSVCRVDLGLWDVIAQFVVTATNRSAKLHLAPSIVGDLATALYIIFRRRTN